MKLPLNRVVHGDYVAEWCKLPYPNHPKGCPMFGTRSSCPPHAPSFREIVEPPYYLVLQEFDLEAQEKRMKELHPNWSRKMCRNSRYWQSTLRRSLMREAQQFLWQFPEGIILERPEANGVNLFSTCRIHGIKLEKNPQKIVKKIVLIGKRKK